MRWLTRPSDTEDRDPEFPVESAVVMFERARLGFTALDSGDAIQLHTHDGRHVWLEDLAPQFFGDHLGH